jgi:hypothetical protein
MPMTNILQDSAGPGEIVCDLPMVHQGLCKMLPKPCEKWPETRLWSHLGKHVFNFPRSDDLNLVLSNVEKHLQYIKCSIGYVTKSLNGAADPTNVVQVWSAFWTLDNCMGLVWFMKSKQAVMMKWMPRVTKDNSWNKHFALLNILTFTIFLQWRPNYLVEYIHIAGRRACQTVSGQNWGCLNWSQWHIWWNSTTTILS